jgi:hypothetical protein
MTCRSSSRSYEAISQLRCRRCDGRQVLTLLDHQCQGEEGGHRRTSLPVVCESKYERSRGSVKVFLRQSYSRLSQPSPGVRFGVVRVQSSSYRDVEHNFILLAILIDAPDHVSAVDLRIILAVLQTQWALQTYSRASVHAQQAIVTPLEILCLDLVGFVGGRVTNRDRRGGSFEGEG